MIGRLLLLLLALSLTACFTTGKRGETSLAVYDLGPAAASVAPRPPRSPMAVEVRAPLWFDTLGIDYRLAYVDAARLREYTRARWVGPPAQLIQLRLMRDLGLQAAGQGRAGCVMRIEITEFTQIFDTPQASWASFQGRVQWLGRQRQRLVDREFSFVQPAQSADAQGGVRALTATVEQLTAALADWEKSLAPQLVACQS